MKAVTRFLGFFGVLFLVATSLPAQVPYAPKVLTDKEYRNAEKYMDRKWSSMVYTNIW